MKRFHSKKRTNSIVVYLGFFVIAVTFSIRYIYRENLINEDSLVELLVNDTFSTYKRRLFDPNFIIKYTLDVDISSDEVNDVEKISLVSKEEKLPIVYIYNTHQDEKYKSSYLGTYNIKSGVFLASKILKEYLSKEGIESIVEESEVTEKLHSLNWSYGKSYKVSRMFMEDAKNRVPSLKYFIDIHRDSSKYTETTTTIDGERYARLLFVIGLENPNYEKNLKFANDLKERINDYNKDLFRGIMKKSGERVNGIYNQDFDENTILIEVGGQYNSIDEVNNTLKVLAKAIKDYIKDDEI